ncbi:hypothetical protein [Pseudomonas kulmbachensis]|uniref:hypothetical protein n=1 Tax=Pseudomonas kulmbachensis TaxID=3043408 RepID=UPI002AAFBF7D|nr:hypothetical protein [Pseudomonas sp. FLM 004-28]
MKKTARILLPLLLMSGCTFDVNVFDHRGEAAEFPTSGKSDFAELYFNSTPLLATVRIISDGLDNSIDKDIGKTPQTFRMGGSNTSPFNRSVCGRTIIVLFEKEGHKTEKVATKINCYKTEQQSEANPNLIRASLSPT